MDERNPARSSDHPNVVALAKRGAGAEDYTIRCSAVIWDERTVLTASHCLLACDSQGCDPKATAEELFIVRGPGADYGEIRDDYTGGEIVPVQSITTHPNYYKGGYKFKNDVAVLKLARPFAVPDFMALDFAKVDDSNVEVLSVSIHGYGWIENSNNGDRFTYGVKSWIDFPLSDSRFSVSVDASRFELTMTDTADLRGSCHGDSGGPIFQTVRHRGTGVVEERLLGLTTTGGDKRYPLPDGRVAKGVCGGPSNAVVLDFHREWILENIEK